MLGEVMNKVGMPPGVYLFGGQQVAVDGRSARLADGTLAGSITTLDQALRNIACWTDATPVDALRMAGEVPARTLGLSDRGRIVPGAIADIALFDDDLTVRVTIARGRVVYSRP